jgi:hypothetical protein
LYDLPERHKCLSAGELAYIQSDRDESHEEAAGKIRAQDLYVHFRAVCSAYSVRDKCRQLDGRSLDWVGWIRTPGVVGEPLFNGFRHDLCAPRFDELSAPELQR